jgi:hypothetical protein
MKMAAHHPDHLWDAGVVHDQPQPDLGWPEGHPYLRGCTKVTPEVTWAGHVPAPWVGQPPLATSGAGHPLPQLGGTVTTSPSIFFFFKKIIFKFFFNIFIYFQIIMTHIIINLLVMT